MDSEKCDVFLCVLEEGSLSAAAEKLGYTPSGVSRIIASMEKEAGLTLLTRGRDGVRATRECEELLPAIRQMHYWGRYYLQQAERIRGIESGSITVGSVYSAFYPWLLEMVAAFSGAHPGIRIEFLEGTSSQMAEAMEEHRCDFCIISRREGSFRFLPLIEDESVAILPLQHPMALRSGFPIRAFETEDFINLYPHRESDTSLLFERHRIHPNVRYATEDLQAGYAMVEAGLGVSMENAVTARQMAGRIAMVPIEPASMVEIGIALPPAEEISPAAAAFADYALQHKPV